MVQNFYRQTFNQNYNEYARHPWPAVGPYRGEFMYWANQWPVGPRAAWAWNNRTYFDDTLWNRWMANPSFAAEVNTLQRQRVPQMPGYLPPEYEKTSPVAVYDDHYLDAVYNPAPSMAVLRLRDLKQDAWDAWIGTATADALVSALSATPGLYLADQDDLTSAMHEQKLSDSDTAEVKPAAAIGKALKLERVVVGTYVVDGDTVLFNLNVVKVETGTVQTGVSKAVPRATLLAAMPELASSLSTALTSGSAQPANAATSTPPGGITGALPQDAVAPRGQSVHVVSRWRNFVNGQKLGINALYSDGHFKRPGSASSWTLSGNKLTLTWANGHTDHVVISPDGKSYHGKNDNGDAVRGERVEDDN